LKVERLEFLKKNIHLLKIDVEKGLILNRKPTLMPRGYLIISLKNKLYKVHEIIAVAGGLDILNKTVNHKDGQKLNNRISNLEAISHGENVKHAYKNGLVDLSKKRGENNGRAKLTENDVREIKRLLAEGKMKQTDISEMFKITPQNILAIKKGKTWTNV
jgi:hypothetical protein